ncbi:MAG: helicase-associated domain-containing protein [Bacteroidales bacterium]|nr:helicase-associated domain-containing protein [Bacteroidales bacterium]
MSPSLRDTWIDRASATLERYAEPLLRGVVTRLVKARMPPPTEELTDRLFATLSNPPVVDRRIRELPEAPRKLLALIGLSHRPDWKVGHLITLLASIGHAEGFGPILHLLQTGLLFPQVAPDAPEITDFEAWLGSAGMLHAKVFALPQVAGRARGEPLGLPDLSQPLSDDAFPSSPVPRFADGLDWPLRLALVWQQVLTMPMRLTQANTLFKRDLGRLQADEVLTTPAADQLAPLPDLGVLAVFWAHATGLLTLKDGELTAAPFPASWGTNLTPTLTELWAGLTALESWDPLIGYDPSEESLSATPSAFFLALLLMSHSAEDQWVTPAAIADWLWEHHPSWSGTIPTAAAAERGHSGIEAFLLGVAYPLQLIEVLPCPDASPLVRLTELGWHLLRGGPAPTPAPAFPQTLLVQPNAEILAYRQGLTPELIGRLSRFAHWKILGPACTLELTADHTYYGLESGLTLAGIIQTLNQHGMKPVPAAVADLLQRWANKRERISVFGSATLVEFQTPADLEAAIARGIVSIRVTDRIGLTDDGREPDFKQLRLIGNRDYEAKPQQCVSVEDDGLTLLIDSALADLLLEAEIVRFADPIPGDPPGLRRFLLTPESLSRAQAEGMSQDDLEAWFSARAGCPLPPAARLFLQGRTLHPWQSTPLLVVQAPSEEMGNGLYQWPATRQWITQRLGPTAFAIAPEQLPQLQAALAEIGVTVTHSEAEHHPDRLITSR